MLKPVPSSRFSRSALLGGLLFLSPLLVPLLAAAERSALFPVSSCPECRKDQARVAGAPSGRFLVVWDGASTQDSRGVLRRLFEPAGTPRGTDAQVNRAIVPVQFDSAVAADFRGYVVAWTESRPNSGSGVVVQRFRPLGTRLGSTVAVDLDPAGSGIQNFGSAVVRTPDGGFVVAWIRFDPSVSGSVPQVFARGFSAAGGPLAPPSLLSAGLASGERPDLCADGSGRVVAAWTTVDAFRPFQASLEGVSARRLSRSGAPLGGELVVARPEASRAPAAVSCGASGFVVAWASDRAPAVDRGDILARRFTVRGRALGSVLLVNTATDGEQRNPAVSHDASGRFVVVWQDFDDRSVAGRRFAADGSALGEQFSVRHDPAATAGPAEPDVAAVGTGGNFVVVWREGRSGVFGRLFSTQGPAALRAGEAEAIAQAEEEEAGDER